MKASELIMFEFGPKETLFQEPEAFLIIVVI